MVRNEDKRSGISRTLKNVKRISHEESQLEKKLHNLNVETAAITKTKITCRKLIYRHHTINRKYKNSKQNIEEKKTMVKRISSFFTHTLYQWHNRKVEKCLKNNYHKILIQ
jgi:hypothetical protein